MFVRDNRCDGRTVPLINKTLREKEEKSSDPASGRGSNELFDPLGRGGGGRGGTGDLFLLGLPRIASLLNGQ